MGRYGFTQKTCPLLRVVSMGISQGKQTISRGELTADFLVCQSADLSTDSKMSSNQHHSRARIFQCMASGCKVANFDLVSRLAAFWSKARFRVFKVKSHQCWLETRTLLNADWHLDFLSQIKRQPCPSRDVHLTFYRWQQASLSTRSLRLLYLRPHLHT